MKDTRNLLTKAAAVLVFLALVFCIAYAWNYGTTVLGIDFREKWTVGQMIAHGAADQVYLGDISVRTSTPFLYSLYAGFSSDNFAHDVRIYRCASLAACVLGIVGLARMLGYTLTAAMAFGVVFMGWFEPFRSDVRVANINQIQVGVLALFLWLQSKRSWPAHGFLAGFVLGIAVAAKPNMIFIPFMLGLFWLVNRRFGKLAHASAGIAAAGAFALVISIAAFGSVRCWAGWLTLARAAGDYWFEVNLYNYSPAMLIFDRFGIKTAPFLAMTLVAACAGAVWIGRERTGGNAREHDATGGICPDSELFEDMLMVSIGCLIYLLCMTLVWLHYFLLIIPMALVALRPSYPNMPGPGRCVIIRRVAAALAILAIAEFPTVMLFPPATPYHKVAMDAFATLTLLGIGIWESARLHKMPKAISPAGKAAPPAVRTGAKR